MNSPMQLVSPAFAEGQPIPIKYSGEGDDVSPPLQWAHAPRGTKSFSLICEDPDAPGQPWIHWFIFNMPPATNKLPQFVPAMQILPDGSQQGLNDFHCLGYGGPMPPPKQVHRYFFKLFAVDTMLKCSELATAAKIHALMKGHILAEAQTFGVYQRRLQKNHQKNNHGK